MNVQLRAFLIAGSVLFLLVIFRLLKEKRLDLRYTLIWLVADAFLLLFAIFPSLVTMLSQVLGIYSPVNTTFLVGGVFMLLIVLSLTVIVSTLRKRLSQVVQEFALLEKKVRDMEREKDNA